VYGCIFYRHVLPSGVGKFFPRANGFIVELVYLLMESISANENITEAAACFEDDIEDVRQSRNGDSQAYGRLINRHQKYIGQILWRFTRDKQEHKELIQDVFVQAYLTINSYREKAPFAHWLSRIAVRTGYHYWKTAAVQKQHNLSIEDWEQIASEQIDRHDADEAAELLYRFLSQLQPRDRLVLTLRYMQGCDVAETARQTGWTKTMVKVQTLRAIRKLRKLFKLNKKET
jgi:RNA polymerase sigma-70 factor, ECF subfamily